jgi:hypothetical protein
MSKKQKSRRRSQLAEFDELAVRPSWIDDWPAPPDGLPVYRLLTGKDDETFGRRVSEALALGYQLYASPSLTINGGDVIAAQAVLWPYQAPPEPDLDDEIPF